MSSNRSTSFSRDGLLELVAAAPLLPPAPTDRIVAPGTAPVDLAATLDALVAFIRRYVVTSDDALTVIAVWTAHTHAFDASDCTRNCRPGRPRVADPSSGGGDHVGGAAAP